MLQAVGGSMLNPVAMSIIRNTFDDWRERAQAIGVWGAVTGIALALGPVFWGDFSCRVLDGGPSSG
jgi:MFS family permease